ncbi:MAG: hypothetical protein HY675_27235 [Chloroflexi bacterium]|nr:hypothetical protein [Chloroflexota bacterium]
MTQIHKRFTDDQVRVLLQGYRQGKLERIVVEEMLGIGKTRFFALLKEHGQDPAQFSLAYQRMSPSRLPASIEEQIRDELAIEKGLINDPSLPITSYNYSAVKDRLGKREIRVSLSTIIDRAKGMGCYQPHPRKKAHNREVITTAIGALIQHDASHHRWSPYASDDWALITSLDDFSRKLLYADFVEEETSWAHIKAAETVIHKYGTPLRYYVDSLRVFRFVQSRDSLWRKHTLQTDQADPQWRQVMRLLGIDVTFALSPQAKGKVERPYRWLQDRIVRTCAIEKLTTIDEVRPVLRDEVDRYNNRQVHSTTGQIPSIRFEEAKKRGDTLFSPFALPKPYTSTKDIFCIREHRTTDGYGKISLFNHKIPVPGVPLREQVEIHMIPDPARGTMAIRIWWERQMKHSANYPLSEFPRVHF